MLLALLAVSFIGLLMSLTSRIWMVLVLSFIILAGEILLSIFAGTSLLAALGYAMLLIGILQISYLFGNLYLSDLGRLINKVCMFLVSKACVSGRKSTLNK
jgi:hypothetical protein